MQSLQECLCRTSQSHLLAKKFFITKMRSNYTKRIHPLVWLDGYINTRVQNDKTWHDEYLLDLDQVAGYCQPSNLSSDFPLGSRKFSSYY